MKVLRLLIALLLCQPLYLNAQNPPLVAPDGGGAAPEVSLGKCLTDAKRLQIQAAIDANIATLRAAGKLPQEWAEATTVLEWPIEVSDELDFNNYYGISGFVDLDPTGGTQDYACGTRTYDGHQGTDYFTWPFPWYQYDNDFVRVVAAAPGVITYREDSHQDKSCDWNGNQNWNAVYVAHADGTVAWYGHLKQSGLTSKNVGDPVNAGEFLGYLASSGRSTGPHLHLEIKSPFGATIDPYFGDCDAQTDLVSWNEQRPLREPTINALMTHSAPPSFGCPNNQEQPNFAHHFDEGTPIIVGAYYKDQMVGSMAQYRIINPNGIEVDSWSQVANATYNGSWWYWTRNLSSNAILGNYTVEMNYEGQSVSRVFSYGIVSSNNEPAFARELTLSPNPTSSRVHWNISLPLTSKVAVLDVSGKILFQAQTDSNANFVDLNNLAPGLYFLRFETEAGSFSRRVIKH